VFNLAPTGTFEEAPLILGSFHHRWRLVLLLVCAAAVLAFAACGGGASPTPAGGGGKAQGMLAASDHDSARTYLQQAIEQGIIAKFLFADKTVTQAVIDEMGVQHFEGMYGTSPATPNPDAGARFDAAFEAAGNKPGAFARQAYDATYVLALAATTANSTAGAAMRDNLRFVANPPGEVAGFGPDEFKKAAGLLKAGTDINFEGASGSADFDVNGDLAKGAINVWRVTGSKITTQETRDIDLQAVAGAQVPAGELKPAASVPDRPLVIGVVAPLAGAGKAIQDAVRMAANEINGAGGVLGRDVQVKAVDEGTGPDTAQAAARQLVQAEGVSAIIGSISSDISQAIAENVTAPAGVLQISPASTSPALTVARDSDLLFRTIISDAAQGAILADIAKESGFSAICELYASDAYGQGVADAFAARFQADGGKVTNRVSVKNGQSDYGSDLKSCAGS
jgi:ABC-type branched-subunit amino acid transport system substrate-binding protein